MCNLMESSEIIHWDDDAVISMQTRTADRTGDFDDKKPPVTPATTPPNKKNSNALPQWHAWIMFTETSNDVAVTTPW